MKKKNIFIIGLTIFVIISIITIFILIERSREKNVNSFEFPSSLVVNNYTDLKRVDTVSMVILNKIFEYDSIVLNIYYMREEMKYNELEILGFIQKNPIPHNYSVFLKKNSGKYQVMRFMSHELIHLDQMERGDLLTSINNYNYAVYKGDTIRYSIVKYKNRPFEIDAHSKDDSIYNKLFYLLFKK